MIGNLKIKPTAAKLTRDTEWFGKMDPYVKVKLGNEVKRTSVQNGAGKFPSWNTVLNFNRGTEDIIEVEVWDADTVSKDDLIGEVSIPIHKAIQEGKSDEWYQLAYKGKPAGQIRVEIIWEAPKFSSQNPAPFIMNGIMNRAAPVNYPSYPPAPYPAQGVNYAPGPANPPVVNPNLSQNIPDYYTYNPPSSSYNPPPNAPSFDQNSGLQNPPNPYTQSAYPPQVSYSSNPPQGYAQNPYPQRSQCPNHPGAPSSYPSYQTVPTYQAPPYYAPNSSAYPQVNPSMISQNSNRAPTNTSQNAYPAQNPMYSTVNYSTQNTPYPQYPGNPYSTLPPNYNNR